MLSTARDWNRPPGCWLRWTTPTRRLCSTKRGSTATICVRAYRWTQARAPVVRLEDGTWVPADPALLDCPGRVEDFLPGEDGNRSWAYSVEIGAHQLAATGILDPAASDVGWMMDYLEESQFLRSGMGDYPEQKNRQDVFNLGGFAKVQPYYGRIAEVYAGRDDVQAVHSLLLQCHSVTAEPGESLVLGAFPQHRRMEQDARNRLVLVSKPHHAGDGARRSSFGWRHL